jgi:hypothetical protein
VPLALGAFAIASALATQRLDTATARSGWHGRRWRGRTDARTDRRPASSAAVGLPEATAEIIASLGEHRVLSTEQVQTIHLPGRSLRRTQQILAGIEEAGLIHHVDTRVAPRRLWFVSERGAALAFELVGLEAQPRVLQAADAAGPLRAHTLAVNDAAICFLKAARERGDEFGPFSWRQEVAHPMSRGRGRRRRTLFADAVLTYLRPEDGDTVLELCFLELDRATLSVDRLVAELSRYAQLYRATDAEGQPLWRDRYPVFPRVLCVLTGASREALTTRRTFASMLLRDHPAMAQARGEVAVSFCRLEDLQRKGPFAPIFREARDRKRHPAPRGEGAFPVWPRSCRFALPRIEIGQDFLAGVVADLEARVGLRVFFACFSLGA